MDVDVWSDLVCPWCWIGLARLRQAAREAGVDVRVRHHAFELDPGRSATEPVMDMLVSKYGAHAPAMVANAEAAARADGLRPGFTKAIAAPTRLAHQVVLAVQASGDAGPVLQRIFRAHFEDGLDISDAAVLRRLGEEAGCPAQAVESGLRGGAWRDAVLEDERQAAAAGVRGVPFFVLDGRRAFSGAHPVPALREVLAQAQRGPQAPRA
ncbi:MAG TPA: DsbA family oxidoreductase [Candidatus Thermoplasmatota archaeon]|nr:DsbA family oxidoreductase [Candidatus Thermoplasmatota archaeon]